MGAVITQAFVEQARDNAAAVAQAEWREGWLGATQRLQDRFVALQKDLVVLRHLISMRSREQNVGPAEILGGVPTILGVAGLDHAGHRHPEHLSTIFAQGVRARHRAEAEASLSAVLGEPSFIATVKRDTHSDYTMIPVPVQANGDYWHVPIVTTSPRMVHRQPGNAFDGRGVEGADVAQLVSDTVRPMESTRAYITSNMPFLTKPTTLPRNAFDPAAFPLSMYKASLFAVPVFRGAAFNDSAAIVEAANLRVSDIPPVEEREARFLGIAGVLFDAESLLKGSLTARIAEPMEAGTSALIEAFSADNADDVGTGAPAWTGGFPKWAEEAPPAQPGQPVLSMAGARFQDPFANDPPCVRDNDLIQRASGKNADMDECDAFRLADPALRVLRVLYVGGSQIRVSISNDGTYVDAHLGAHSVVWEDPKTLMSIVLTVVLALVVAVAVGFVEVRHKQQAADAERMAARAAGEAYRTTLSFACHELRNPLHAVTAAAAFLQETVLAAQAHGGALRADDLVEDVDVIVMQAQSMRTLANDVLDLSALSAGRMKIVPGSVDLRDLVSSVVNMYRPMARVPLVCDVAASVPAHVQLDGLRLRQVLTNSLTNACKLTATGKIVVRVERVVEPRSPTSHVGDRHHSDDASSDAVSGAGVALALAHGNRADVAVGMGGDETRNVRRGFATSDDDAPQARAPPAVMDARRADRTPRHSLDEIDEEKASGPLADGAAAEAPAPVQTPDLVVSTSSHDLRSAVSPTARERLVFSVVDTGPGLRGADPSSLFEPFVTGDSTETRGNLRRGFSRGDRAALGTGLGLQIASQLAKAMGGDISLADNASGTGATLQFWVPLHVAAAAEPPARGPLRVHTMSAVGSLASRASGSLRELTLPPVAAQKPGVASMRSASTMRSAGTSATLGTMGTSHTIGSSALGTPQGSMQMESADMLLRAMSLTPVASDGEGARRGLGEAQDRQQLAAHVHGSPPAASPSSLGSSTLAGSHWLLVDDERVNRRVAARMVRALGATVDVLEDGDEVEPYLRQHFPEVFAGDQAASAAHASRANSHDSRGSRVSGSAGLVGALSDSTSPGAPLHTPARPPSDEAADTRGSSALGGAGDAPRSSPRSSARSDARASAGPDGAGTGSRSGSSDGGRTGDTTVVAPAGRGSRPLAGILMDIEMARSTGDAITARLRSVGVHVPVCAVTGNAAQHDRERYLAFGMDSVLTKPFSKAELAAKMQELLAE